MLLQATKEKEKPSPTSAPLRPPKSRPLPKEITTRAAGTTNPHPRRRRRRRLLLLRSPKEPSRRSRSVHGGAGVQAGAAAGQGLRGDAVRGQERVRLPQDPHGEEQAVRRAAAHRRKVPGALQAALLHPHRQPPRPLRGILEGGGPSEAAVEKQERSERGARRHHRSVRPRALRVVLRRRDRRPRFHLHGLQRLRAPSFHDYLHSRGRRRLRAEDSVSQSVSRDARCEVLVFLKKKIPFLMLVKKSTPGPVNSTRR